MGRGLNLLLVMMLGLTLAGAGELRLDGDTRPGPGSRHVPPRTSFFVQINLAGDAAADRILPDSVGLRLEREGAAGVDLLLPGGRFAPGCRGSLAPAKGRWGESALAVNIEAATPLLPGATYVLIATAETRAGAPFPAARRRWTFSTETLPATTSLAFSLDLGAPAVAWQGAFFSGICKPSFCTSAPQRVPGYRLMDAARKEHPRAWSLQRDCFPTSTEYQPRFLMAGHPNVVRERETRRITAMRPQAGGVRLELEDFFGHEQYGIPSGRPADADYHPGNEVLVADGERSARARVISAASASLVITPIDATPGYWKLAYSGPLPDREDPHAPGLFAPGGCYLRKFNPVGTPHYYWGRLDAEYDLLHRRFGRRLLVNFCEGPGDLSVDGGPYTTAKDLVQLHEVTRAITAHLLERYGEACLDFVWSIFNEPDLSRAFWRCEDWLELQRFYDYSVDAILRAFEDAGYDSERVFIGGLELGAIFGARGLKVREFLAHCSPSASHEGALEYNAAYADPRLEGRRSRRVEQLCAAHGGRGSPCDFISVHAYDRSEETAGKLIVAKQIALEIDPDYYAGLWVNTHESCLNWSGHPDAAVADSYMGNGYFPTWCADVASRLLHRAGEDPRFGFGESLLTVWPWPNQNFAGMNAVTREIAVDDNGDGQADRKETVVMPIFHFLTLLSDLSDRFWLLPQRTIEGHTVSGFAARGQGKLRLLLYSHNGADMESRSDKGFEVELELLGTGWEAARAREYRFDRAHNTYYELARQLAGRSVAGEAVAPGELDALVERLEQGAAERRIAALERLGELGPAARPALAKISQLAQESEDEAVKQAAVAALFRLAAHQPVYSPEEVAEVQRQAQLRATRDSTPTAADGRLRLRLALAGNGVNFVVLEPH